MAACRREQDAAQQAVGAEITAKHGERFIDVADFVAETLPTLRCERGFEVRLTQANGEAIAEMVPRRSLRVFRVMHNTRRPSDSSESASGEGCPGMCRLNHCRVIAWRSFKAAVADQTMPQTQRIGET